MAAGDKWEEDIPEWLAQLSPGLVAEEAAIAAKEWARVAQDLRRRTRKFVHNAWVGVPCRILDQVSGKGLQASYVLDEDAAALMVNEHQVPGRCARDHLCALADVRNIWVCADSALARRWHGSIHGMADSNLACLVLLDAPTGPLGLVMRSSEAREDFLDCLAVLISAQRLRSEPGLARCDLPGGLPPPEAQLRPPGRSLQSVHLSGPICAWLARVGEELLMPEVDQADGAEGSVLHLPASGTGPEASTGGTLDRPLASARPQRDAATTGGASVAALSPASAASPVVTAASAVAVAVVGVPRGPSQQKAPQSRVGLGASRQVPSASAPGPSSAGCGGDVGGGGGGGPRTPRDAPRGGAVDMPL